MQKIPFFELFPSLPLPWEQRMALDGAYLTAKGEPLYEKIPKEGVDTELMAKASWKNWKETFYYHLHLLPKEYTSEEL